MAVYDAQHMIEEIQANIKTGDLMKTKLVLAHLGEVDKKTQNRLIYELSRGDVRFTVPVLLHMMTEHVEIVDALPIIKETLLSSLLAYPELLIEFLSDSSIKDKTHLINVAGELRYD
jgi:hypothetical protein